VKIITAIRSRPWSFLLVLLLFSIIVILRFYHPVRNVISWDVFGYYLYLPALFIYGDPGLRDPAWVHALIEQYNNTATFYQVIAGPEGGMIIKYSCGMAVMYSPFFFAAHLLAPSLGYAADGLSDPYQLALVFGGLLYTLAGMLLLRRLLLEFFGDRLTALVILLVVAGTNYLQMAYAGGLLTHNVLFGLYALAFLLTVQWYRTFRPVVAAWLGLSIGMITLIRPTDMLVLLIPLLYGIHRQTELKQRLRLLIKNHRSLLAFIICIILAGLPQILYWKSQTGSFIFYSYVNPGEGFDFLSPHTLKFLFSFRKGWLIYTPLMLFALAGLMMMYRSKHKAFLSLGIFLALYLYVVSSWTCWYYAGSFSQRPMVQVYPFLAIPMGFAFASISRLKKYLRAFFGLVAALMLILNLFQTWQYSFANILDGSRMTAPYYFKIFAKTRIHPDDRQLLLVERSVVSEEYFTDSLRYQEGKLLYFNGFENNVANHANIISDSLAFSGKHVLRMDSDNIYSPGLYIKYRDLSRADHVWIRASVWVFAPMPANPLALVITFDHKGGAYKWTGTEYTGQAAAERKGDWVKISRDYMSPEVRSGHDKLSVYCWLRGKKPVLIDDLKVEVFEPLSH